MKYKISYKKQYNKEGTFYNQLINITSSNEEINSLNRKIEQLRQTDKNCDLYLKNLQKGLNFCTLTTANKVVQFFNIADKRYLNRNTVINITILNNIDKNSVKYKLLQLHKLSRQYRFLDAYSDNEISKVFNHGNGCTKFAEVDETKKIVYINKWITKKRDKENILFIFENYKLVSVDYDFYSMKKLSSTYKENRK